MKKTLEILTPGKALLNIKNTAISTRVGDWGMESTYVKDLSSTQQPFAVLDLALTELAEIKKVVENWDEGEYYTDSIHSMKKIEDILKGEIV